MYVGSAVSIHCITKSYSTWTKNNKKIRRGYKITGTSLHIDEVKTNDEGVYGCHGTDEENRPFTATSEIIVTGK